MQICSRGDAGEYGGPGYAATIAYSVEALSQSGTNIHSFAELSGTMRNTTTTLRCRPDVRREKHLSAHGFVAGMRKNTGLLVLSICGGLLIALQLLIPSLAFASTSGARATMLSLPHNKKRLTWPMLRWYAWSSPIRCLEALPG